MEAHYLKYITGLHESLQRIPADDLSKLINLILDVQRNKNIVFIVGNGGNASTATHWATDLGKGLQHKAGTGLKAMSLADNVSWITAVANDINYDEIFADQIKVHGKKGDLLICLSASGESKNIIRAIEQAKHIDMITFSIVGFDGGKVKNISDHTIHIKTANGEYGIVEDTQLILNHFISDYLVARSSRSKH